MDEPGQECGHDDRHRNNDQDDGGGSNDHERPLSRRGGIEKPGDDCDRREPRKARTNSLPFREHRHAWIGSGEA
jgi:hypothetical protein